MVTGSRSGAPLPAAEGGRHVTVLQQPGDVLVASLGELLPRACVAPESLGPAIVKADCIRVRSGAAVVPSLLMWVLNAPQTRERVGESIKGVGRPGINLRDLRALELPIPPLGEQERIVAAIEEASPSSPLATPAPHRPPAPQAHARRHPRGRPRRPTRPPSPVWAVSTDSRPTPRSASSFDARGLARIEGRR